jgi:hypothetical protein
MCFSQDFYFCSASSSHSYPLEGVKLSPVVDQVHEADVYFGAGGPAATHKLANPCGTGKDVSGSIAGMRASYVALCSPGSQRLAASALAVKWLRKPLACKSASVTSER